MLDLVLWSCVLSLAPWALALAWSLIAGIVRWFSPAVEKRSVPLPSESWASQAGRGPITSSS